MLPCLRGSMVAPKSSDFNNFAALADVDDLKAPANDAGVTKALPDLLWGRIGGDVEVLRAVS